jgi:competence ComEA-like helix-hairpin-helix protein
MHNVNRNRINAQEQALRRNSYGPHEPDKEGDTSAATQSIDLNHATFEQLCEVDDLSEQEADAIIQYRTLYGHFRSWEDVRKVPDIGDACVEKLQHAARIGGPVV